jgi:hypothetical protein
MPDNDPTGAVPPLNPVPPQQPPLKNHSRTWDMWCHLSALSGLLIPFGNVLGPLLVWQIKKNEFPSVEAHGKAALNFQLTILIALAAGAVVGFLVFLVLPPIALCGLIFAIIAGLKASDGIDYKYPYSLKLVS